MRNLKRVLSLALALVMVLGMMVIGTSAATFTDAEEITYTEAVDVMAALGILKGNPNADGTFTFDPKGTLTREGAAKILAFVCMGEDADTYLTGAAAPFADVAADRWSAKYVAYCKNLGILNGVDAAGTQFNPTGNISVVGFAKLLLGAIEVEGKYTGAGWEENVKKAVATVPSMAATGIKITNADITREEACELALAAMKAGETYSKGYYIEGKEVEFGYSESYADAYIMAKAMGIADPVIKKHTATRNSLLKDTYKVTFDADATDAFGRPGNSYTYEVNEEEVELFFADEALAKFEGPVAEKTLFAAAKVADKTATSITYTIVQDGVDISDWGTFTAAKAEKATSANWTAAGTGYGIKSELYMEVVEETPVYTLVAVREYLGTVKKVNPADPKVATSKRSIDVQLDIVPTGNETTKTINYKTEAFAEKDVVVVTVAAGAIKTIAAAKSVSGTPTKVANGAVTIGGVEYVNSQNASGVSYTLGTAGEWYVDSFGNLLANKSAVTPKAAEYYGILKAVDGKAYVAAGQALTLLGEGSKGQEAQEVIQILTADGKTVTFDTAWKYLYEDATDETKITGVKFVNAAEQEGSAADKDSYTATGVTVANTLVKYELDKNGKISKITSVGIADVATGKLETGKATLGAGYDKVVTDKTVFFLKVNDNNPATTDKYVAYTGYKTVPTVTIDKSFVVNGKTAAGTDDGTYAIVVIEGTAVDPVVAVKTNYIYFADTAYTTLWDAEEEAAVYVYENVYLNGTKTPVTFTAVQSNAVKGEMYSYTVNAKGVMNIAYGFNLLLGEVVTLIHDDFYVAGGVTYVNADTVYYQISATGVAQVAGLPEVEDDECIVAYYTIANADPKVDAVATVYFAVVDAVEFPAVFTNDSYVRIQATGAFPKVHFAEAVEVKAGELTIVLYDGTTKLGEVTNKKDMDQESYSTGFYVDEYTSGSWEGVYSDLGEDLLDADYAEFYINGVLAGTTAFVNDIR